MNEKLIERLRAAGHDERLATGALYLEAADALAAQPDVEAVIEACANVCDDPYEHLAETLWEKGFTAGERSCANRVRSLDRSQFNAPSPDALAQRREGKRG